MTDSKIAALHDLYCKVTGFNLPLRMGRDRVWFDYDKAGFTGADLVDVITWIRRQINSPKSGYTMSSLRFSTLLQLDYFEEKLQLARMDKRSRQRPPATIQVTQKVGDIQRQIEAPAPELEPVHAGAVGSNLLREWLQQKKGKLPTSDSATPEAARTTP